MTVSDAIDLAHDFQLGHEEALDVGYSALLVARPHQTQPSTHSQLRNSLHWSKNQ